MPSSSRWSVTQASARHAVVEAGRVRVDAELAGAVAVLDADDDEAGRGELVAPADVRRRRPPRG